MQPHFKREGEFTMTTLISPDNSLALMAITCVCVAFSIYAEQKWEWASRMSGAIIALILAMTLTNLHIIPTSAVWFDDIIWGYAVPLAIPMLLMQCDIRKIWRESGKLLLLFVIGSCGTAFAAVLGYYLLNAHIDQLAGVAAMMTGSYIGGGVNFAALSVSFDVPNETVAATTVADNMLMALYFFVLVSIPTIPFFRKHYTHPHQDAIERSAGENDGETIAASYWDRKGISLKDIAISVALSSAIVALSTAIAGVLGEAIPKSNVVLTMCNGLFGNKYLIITTLSMLVATFGSKQVAKVAGTQEIGTYLIYLFFFAIGVPASIMQIITDAPLLFVYCALIVAINMAVCFLFGKLLKYDLEDIILASNANIGGPTTAVAMAISKGWTKLVGPILLVGTLGYIIGTYFGIFVGQLLGA